MKELVLVLAMALGTSAFAAAPTPTTEKPKAEAVKKEEVNCVKKDKAGKCPPPPKSPKPTPKKPIVKEADKK